MKIVVITGSTKGIGHGLAREFLKRDCSVVISSRSKSKLEQVVADLRKEFGAERLEAACTRALDIGASSLTNFSISSVSPGYSGTLAA